MSDKNYAQISDARWNQERFLIEARWDCGAGGKFSLSLPFEADAIRLNPMEAARLRHALDEFIQEKMKVGIDARLEAEQVKFYVQRNTCIGWEDAGWRSDDTTTPRLFPTVEAANQAIKDYVVYFNNLQSTLPDEAVTVEDFRPAIYEPEAE